MDAYGIYRCIIEKIRLGFLIGANKVFFWELEDGYTCTIHWE